MSTDWDTGSTPHKYHSNLGRMAEAGAKREAEDKTGYLVAKKTRTDDSVVIKRPDGPPRTSDLHAPIMLLEGHAGEIYCMKFSPDGKHLASGSHDKRIFLWNVFGDCDNYSMLEGHSGAVLEVHWSGDGQQIFSASSDKTVGVWDAISGRRVKKLTAHSSFVNTVCPARDKLNLVISGSDDGTAKLWDTRVRSCQQSFSHTYQVTSVAFAHDGEKFYTGGIDNIIRVWDIRKGEVALTMPGHQDTVTGMRVSPDGTYLLSNAMDNTVRCWDVQPFCSGDRCLKVFLGAQHNFEKNLLKCNWSAKGDKITAGSSDRFVYVWDTTTRRILYKLPGHSGSVNEVDFHPTQPIIGSCSSDKKIYLGEIAA